jgi:hypothetical protein
MPLFTKLALVTCAFYLGVNVLLDVAMFGITLRKGGSALYFSSRLVGLLFFGLIWLFSFVLAWRIVLAPLQAKLLK